MHQVICQYVSTMPRIGGGSAVAAKRKSPFQSFTVATLIIFSCFSSCVSVFVSPAFIESTNDSTLPVSADGAIRDVSSLSAAYAVPRRENLEVVNTSSIFNFCWRDTYTRKSRGKKGLSKCPMRQQNVMGDCMPKCKAGYRPAGSLCVHDCSAYGGKWTNCGMGCAPSKEECVKNVYNQLTTTAVWVANVVIPGSAIFASRMSAIGAPVAMSYGGVKGVARMTRGPDAVIARKTMEKRALVAMLTAAHARRLDKKGGAVGIFSPRTQNKPARYQQFRQRNQVSTQMATRVADVIVRAVRKDKAAVNIEDLAKYDPSGTLPMLVAYSHPLCSKNECAKCSVTSNPCIAGYTCNSGKCGNPIVEPDGTSCVDSDYQGNTFPGFCQSGTCQISTVQSYYGSAQKTSMWLPEGVSLPTLPELKISVSPRLAGTNGSAEGFVGRSLGFWHRLSRQSRSCTFNNGGCGVFACRVDYKRKKTACVNPKKMGFLAAPMGIDFPRGATINYSFPTAPAKCMQKCKKLQACVLAVATIGRECWLKSSVGNATVVSISFQAYKKL